jgi:RNA polymerase sigma-70 factor (ECF subfamily)
MASCRVYPGGLPGGDKPRRSLIGTTGQLEVLLSTAVADMETLAELFQQYRDRLLAMVQRRLDPALRARIDPEGILSDAFIRAQRQWDRMRDHPQRQLYPWFYRLVLDCLIAAWHRHHRGLRDVDRDVPFPERSSICLALNLINSHTTPTAEARRRELEVQMKQALSLLKETDRQILWMRHYDDLSFAEAAQVLGIGESAATLRYVRALKRLKTLWLQLHPEEGIER